MMIYAYNRIIIQKTTSHEYKNITIFWYNDTPTHIIPKKDLTVYVYPII